MNFTTASTKLTTLPANVTPRATARAISEQFKCCVERNLYNVDLTKVSGLDELGSLFSSCKQYQRNKSERIVYPVINFFTSDRSTEEKTCRNFYCEVSPSMWYKVFIAAMSITLFVAILGNLLACSVILKARLIQKRVTNCFLFSLAVSDLFVSLFVIPLNINKALTNGHFCNSINICHLSTTADYVFFSASVTHMFIICVDRYLAILRPYQYKLIMSYGRCKLITAAIWIYSFIWGGVLNNMNLTNFSFGDTLEVDEFVCKRRRTVLYQILYPVVFFAPCFIMIILYAHIWSIALSQAHIIRKQKQTYSSRSSMDKVTSSNIKSFLASRKLELKATKVIFTVFGTFFLCWSPVILMTYVAAYGHDIKISNTVYLILCEVLPSLNSTLNPFIYCILHRDFRRGLKQIIRQLSYKTAHKLSFNKKKSGTYIGGSRTYYSESEAHHL